LDSGIWYTSISIGTGLIGYANVDWEGSLEDRKSTIGYIFRLGLGAISWCNKKQPTIALSSTKLKYKYTSATIKEVIWLRIILEYL